MLKEMERVTYFFFVKKTSTENTALLPNAYRVFKKFCCASAVGCCIGGKCPGVKMSDTRPTHASHVA